MAQVKYSRIESRKSASNYCSTVVIAVFVAVCLLGIWFLTSSSVGPAQNPELVSKRPSDFGLNKPVQFEDSQGELPDKPSSSSSSKEEDGEKRTEPDDDISMSKHESDGTGNRNAEPSENRTDADDVSNEGEGERDGAAAGEREDDAGERGERSPEGGESSAAEKAENATLPEPELLPSVAQSELLNETAVARNGSWSTQAAESRREKEGQEKEGSPGEEEAASGHAWKLCNTTAGADYIPCLDNAEALKLLRSTKHYEHRERHCPESSPTCLVPLPEGYRRPIKWPESRDRIWYTNVPHTKLAEIKGHQNWVKVSGEYLTFPGGGTQFKHGALHYIEFIEQMSGAVAWGRRSRVVLDVGCGVASFGGYLFEKDVLSMSFAPKDEHEAQVQFALERGIPAISAVMGTNRLPFPSIVFDAVHCARCRVPWHIEGGKLLLELNRVLRPGGFFVWSATPVYQKHPEDMKIWKEMGELTNSMCWELVVVKRDRVNGVGAAVYRKPTTNECYRSRPVNEPPLCAESDDPNAAWSVGLRRCMHEVPTDEAKRGSRWPSDWPGRLAATPYWMGGAEAGVYGRAAPEDFNADYRHWSRVVQKSYLNGMGIDWANVRNVMDMRAVYGGFAASLNGLKVWVMNVVSVDSPDTLQIIYERGLFGIYHDWCESFSTYPRSYDLLHADHLFSKIKNKCGVVGLMAEVDRILRPEGNIIVRDSVEMIGEVEAMARSIRWEVRLTYTKEKEGLLCLQKTAWRPDETVTESA